MLEMAGVRIQNHFSNEMQQQQHQRVLRHPSTLGCPYRVLYGRYRRPLHHIPVGLGPDHGHCVVCQASSDDDVLIEFRDVHKSFGSKHILKGASFKIRRGEAVGIIGSSGTGKSTTLRLAAGLLEADSVRALYVWRVLQCAHITCITLYCREKF